MVTKKRIYSLIKLGIPFCFPLFLLVIIGFFVISDSVEYVKECIAFCLLSFAFFLLLLFIKSFRARYFFSCLTLAFLFFLLAIKLSFYSHYGVKLNASALFVIFETNGTEASDFLSNYFNFTVVSLLILFFVVFFISIALLKKQKQTNFHLNTINKIISFILILLSFFIIHFKFTQHSILFSSFISFSEYKTVKANLKKNLAQPLSHFNNAEAKTNKQQTYVIVIGESTTRWHMQLYGYGRETNPKLTEIRQELTVFNNVIAPNVHTLRALDKTLTLSDILSPYKEENTSIVQLANAAGFTTFWLSNQKPVGFYESVPTIISNAAQHKKYINTDGYQYDGALLQHLEDALNNKASKKVIFLHLIGTHGSYKRRFPPKFDYFNDMPNTLYPSNTSKNLINAYDNAVLYNDFIIREIIEKVRSKNENSYVAYFSDHGDEVFDTFDFVGHNEYHGSKPMYEIPFILWFSEAYKENNKSIFEIKDLTNRPYIMEDFIHSFSEISNISFDAFNYEKSIFNINFKTKTRLVKKGEDYDKK